MREEWFADYLCGKPFAVPRRSGEPQNVWRQPNDADKQAGSHVGLPVGALKHSKRKHSGNQTSLAEKR
jgi:hypothetical protein